MDTRTSEFEGLRPYLFAIAYRMLGSVADAEDVVQEAFLRWTGAAAANVASPKAYLSKIVTRLSIDRLRSGRARRETYVGPWLPEPLVDDPAPDVADVVERADTLSMAFLVVLETLSPLERAAFLLRDVFAYGYADVAAILDRREDACRQLVRRARAHIAERRPRYDVDPTRHEELLVRFTAACATGDAAALGALLTDDVVLQSDGGGRIRAARKPIFGREKVVRFVLGIVRKEAPSTWTRVASVNGQAGLAVYRDDDLTSVLTLDTADGLVQGIQIVVNPEKLGGRAARQA